MSDSYMCYEEKERLPLVQGLRIRLPRYGTQVQSLAWEDPT